MNKKNADQDDKREGIYFVIKLLVLAVLGAGILFASLWTVIVGALGGNNILLFSGVALTLLGIPLLLVSLFMRRIKRKAKVWLWCALLALLIVPNGINESYKLYDESFTRIEEGLEVYSYMPFDENTRAVYLNEPSLLSLAEPLPRLDGARALYPLYSAFAQATYPKNTYDFSSEVGYNNTIPAYDRLIKRDADIIFVVSPSKEQLGEAQEKNVKIKLTPIGQDAFVFFVNAKNPVNNLTSEEIKGIYSGKITNWQQLGGNNQAIRAFQRNKGSGSQSAFLNFMQDTPVMNAPTEDVVEGMGGIIERTANYANYPNSIGFSFRYFSQTMIANNEIKLLSIDGVHPSVDTIASGAYPLSVSFYAATLEDNKKENVAKMLAWILSPQGQWLVEKTGYAPIK